MTIGIIISIVISYILRIWILRQIFSQQEKQQILMISLRSALYALLAFVLYNISHFIPVLQGSYSQYLIIVVILFIFIIPSLPVGGKSWISQSLLWIGLGLGLSNKISTYSLSARGEESLKWKSLKNNTSGLIQSMILGGMVSAIVFGQVENSIYVSIAYLQSHDILGSLALLGNRSFLPIIVHIGSLCLGCISIIQLKPYIKSNTFLRGIGAIISIGSHFLYNVSQSDPSLKILSLVLMALYIISIHYSLFKSDTLYTKTGITTQ